MLHSGFTTAKQEIVFDHYGQDILLIPFGDIHRSSPLHHEGKWFEWLEWAKKQDNAFFLGMGDYDDMGSGSERPILKDDRLHDSTLETLDDLYMVHVNRLVEELSFMKGRIIGLVEGNHFAEFSGSGITTTQKMCEMLKCKYLGVSSFIKLIFRYRDNATTHAIDVIVNHGLSGGRTVGASINKIENMIKGFHADIYLQGHDHKRHIAMQSRLQLSDGRQGLFLENRKIVMARTGGFLRGYVDGKASYVAEKAYNPVDIGTITIRLTPTRTYRDRVDRRWVELHASL